MLQVLERGADSSNYYERNQNKKEELSRGILLNTTTKHPRCPFCPYKSYYRAHVKRHIMFKHTGEKPFQCSICSKRFTLKENLQAHFRIHTGEKPFQCPVCSRKFTQKITLKVHINSIHQEYNLKVN